MGTKAFCCDFSCEYDFHAEPSDILSPLYDCITVNAHSADDCNQTAKMTDRWRL